MTKDIIVEPLSPEDNDGQYPSRFVGVWQIAERELRETPSRRQKDLHLMREMIRNDPEINSRMDDAFLLRFLRCRKFDCHRAYKVLRQYYKLRFNNPQLFKAFHPTNQRETFKHNLQTVLPERDPMGCAVFVFKGGLWNPYACTAEDIFRANVMCLEQAIVDPVTQVTGIVALMDMKGFSFTHLRFCPASHLQKVVSLIQDCFPARFKAIHIVNEPAIFSVLFSIVKPFLNEKLQKRIHFHGYDTSSLHQHLPAKILPEEYGGMMGRMDNSDFVQLMCRNDDMFKKDSAFGFKGKVKTDS